MGTRDGLVVVVLPAGIVVGETRMLTDGDVRDVSLTKGSWPGRSQIWKNRGRVIPSSAGVNEAIA